MKPEMLIVAIAILFIGFLILRDVLPKEASFANEITMPQNEASENVVYDEYGNIISNTIEENVDISVFEETR